MGWVKFVEIRCCGTDVARDLYPIEETGERLSGTHIKRVTGRRSVPDTGLRCPLCTRKRLAG